MAGRISFLFELAGIDPSIQKVHGLTRALSDLDKVASTGPKQTGAMGEWEKLLKSMSPNQLNRTISNNPDLRAIWSKMGGLGTPPVISAAGLGGGGGIGGIFKSILGGADNPLAKGIVAGTTALLAFRTALWAIQPIINLFKKGLQELAEAVQRGAKLFEDAAKLGTNSGRLRGLQFAFGSAGIDSGTLDRLLLNTEFQTMLRSGRGGMIGGQVRGTRGLQGNVAGAAVTALRGVGQYGEVQQILNMSQQINRAWRDAAVDSFIAAKNSKNLFEISYQLSRIKREWNTLWEELATQLGTVLLPVLSEITQNLKTLNFVVASADPMFTRIFGKLLPNQGEHNLAFGGTGQQRIPANQFQRMGFVFGQGNFQQNYASETARNTKETAKGIHELVKMAIRGSGHPHVYAPTMTNP